MRQRAGLVREAEGGLDRALDWGEAHAADPLRRASRSAHGHPLAQRLLGAGAGLVDGQAQFDGGALKSVGGMVSGLAQAHEDPVDAAGGLWAMAEHPLNPLMTGAMNPFSVAHGLYDATLGGQDPASAAGRLLHAINADIAFNERLVAGLLDPYARSLRDHKPAEAAGRTS